MTRNIKFRCWDKKKKKFLAIGFHIVGEVTLFNLLNDRPIEDLDDLVIQQFTGIKDRNGKEIYEGDMIKLRNITGVVEMYAGMFIIDFPDQTDSGPMGFLLIDELEIVGNMFEKQELINE